MRARLVFAIVLCVGIASSTVAGGDAPAEAAPPTAPPGSVARPAPAPAATPRPGPPEDCSAKLALRVQSHYDRVRDLEARFTQRTVSALSPGGDVSTGRVVLAKPGLMRWTYETPEPSLVVSDGETLWIFDPAAREVQELRVGENFMSGAALQFLLGNGRILDSFTVAADRCDAARARLTLLPKTDATYEKLELDIDARSGEARATVVVDLFGNRTEVEFSELHYDRAPDASTFRFVAEPGVRVLTLEPPTP